MSMLTTHRVIEYRGFVIDQAAFGVWYVRRPGSWLEAMWTPRTETPEQQELAIDRWHERQGS